jgi:hypothetical protein
MCAGASQYRCDSDVATPLTLKAEDLMAMPCEKVSNPTRMELRWNGEILKKANLPRPVHPSGGRADPAWREWSVSIRQEVPAVRKKRAAVSGCRALFERRIV